MIDIIYDMVKVANDLDKKGLLNEADMMTGLIEKFAKKDDFSYQDLEGTDFIRLLEMTVESQTTQPNNVPLVLQFFKDLKLYGLNEAIAYVKGYEEQGYYKSGTHAELIRVKQMIDRDLRQPMESGQEGSYVFNEDIESAINNRYYKIEGSLPILSRLSEDKGLVSREWVEKLASLANIPVELAYVWTTNYWTEEAVSPEVKAVSDNLKNSGKVAVEF